MKKALQVLLVKRVMVILFLLFSFAYTASSQTILYVNTSATGPYTGNSWSNAFPVLEMALATAHLPGNESVNYEIRVAAGTHMPYNRQGGGARDETFAIKRGGIKILGGYNAANGTRNITANLTILSGDIGTINTKTDNTYHIMAIAGLAVAADSVVVEGFTFTKGYAYGAEDAGHLTINGQGLHRLTGGALITQGNNNNNKTAIRNCIFTQNEALNGAGAVENNYNSAPYFTNCSFTDNKVETSRGSTGGAVRNTNNSLAKFKGCTFSGNEADYGGGVNNSGADAAYTDCTFFQNYSWISGAGVFNVASSSIFDNCIFTDNASSVDGGGGMYVSGNCSPIIRNCKFQGNQAGGDGGGAMYIRNWSCSTTIINCLFISNSAIGNGYTSGGIYNFDAATTVANCTFYGNNALGSFSGGGFCNANTMSNTSVKITNSIFWNNTGPIGTVGIYNHNGAAVVATNCLVQQPEGVYVGKGNINVNPLFINAADADGADNVLGTADDGLRLQSCSPALNAGNNAGVLATDVLGNARIANTVVDMGAYEFQTIAGGAKFSEFTHFLCMGDSILFNNAYLKTAGTYKDTLQTGFGCDSIITLYLKERPKPQSANNIPNQFICNGTASSPVMLTSNQLYDSLCGKVMKTVALNLAAPPGAVFSRVLFTGYGDISGSCPSGNFVQESCYAPEARNVIESLALGNNSFSITPSDYIFGGNPCPDYPYATYLAVKLTYGVNPDSVVYTWTNNKPSIGLPASGIGNIPSFIAVNNSNKPDTALITVTTSYNGCSSASVSFMMIVNPPVSKINIYVDSLNGNDTNSGNSWNNAFKTLSHALKVAHNNTINACYTFNDSILVAKGTYYPTGNQSGTNRDSTFAITRGGLKIYGGYPGGGGVRDVTANPTILSGAINTADSADNSRHVMVIAGMPANADSLIIDGFIIRDGHADGEEAIFINGELIVNKDGGGIVIKGNNSNGPVFLRHCLFTNNYTTQCGGGMYNNRSSPVVINCNFINNTANGLGGGMANLYESSPKVINCVFSGNKTFYIGGGVYNQSPNSYPVFTGCSFINNRSSAAGGAMMNADASSSEITNSIFSGNSSGNGGGIYNQNVKAVIANCSFSGNSASAGSWISNAANSVASVTNCIAWNNGNNSVYNSSTLYITYSNIQGTSVYAGVGNINSDPLFINAPADLRISAYSPAFNTGNNDSIPAGITTDITGAARIFSNKVDMGAHEYYGTLPAYSKIYVDSVNGNDIHNGNSWTNAFKTLSHAIKLVHDNSSFYSMVDSVLVTKGTYYPTGLQRSTNRDSTFAITRSNLKIYGGYPSGGGIRNAATNVTIISGAINTESDEDNSHHLIVIAGITSATDSIVIDGFTFTKGHAYIGGTIQINGYTVNKGLGAAMVTMNNNTNIAIRQCSFANNTAYFGGAVKNYSSSPYFENCLFLNNTVFARGGAVDNQASNSRYKNCTFQNNTTTSNGSSGGAMANTETSSPIINNCIFENNTSYTGGGMYNDIANTNPIITNCSFANNNASERGGAMVNADAASPVITGCSFVGNTGGLAGGGVLNRDADTRPVFTNCTFTGNVANNGSWIINNFNANVSVVNSIAWNNGNNSVTVNNNAVFTVSYSNIQGSSVYAGTGNINADPLFVNASDPDGADNIFGTSDDGIQLQQGSPCINTGDTRIVLANSKDILGNARIQESIVDMGAYESSYSILPLRLLSFEGKRTNGINNLVWKTANESNLTDYEVQRSTNAQEFTTIATVKANNGITQSYTYNDKLEFTGKLYYRIKINEADGKVSYSKIVTLTDNEQPSTISIYPNPARSVVRIKMTDDRLQNTELIILNTLGKAVSKHVIKSTTQPVNISTLAQGIYFVKFANGEIQKLIKE